MSTPVCSTSGTLECVEIPVYGSLDFLVATVEALTRLSNAPELVVMAKLAFMIVFGWSFIKALLEDKPGLPFKNFFIGTTMFALIAAPSIKINVLFLPQSEPHLAPREVNDVPLLVAAPTYVASNLLLGVKDSLELEFKTAGSYYEPASTDVLSELVALYSATPDDYLITRGSNGSYDLDKTMKNYMVECVAMDYKLDGAEPTSSFAKFKVENFSEGNNQFDGLRVDFDGIYTTVFLDTAGSQFGEFLSCPDALTFLDLTRKP